MTDTTVTPPKIELAAEVGKFAQRIKAIQPVVQTGGSFRFDLVRLFKKPTLTIRGRDDEKSRVTLDGDRLTVERDFALHGTDDTDQAVVVEIAATFRIGYELTAAEAIDAEVVQAAADLNSRFNLTAYWREFVQACCARAGLPPLPIAPYNAIRALNSLKPKPLAESAAEVAP